MIDHDKMINALSAAQTDEHDMREQVREAHLFVNKRDGQWEPEWWQSNSGKPRYTFDLTNPIIDQIAGEMEQADFDIRVKPAGGQATKDIAETYDGLIRNIENISNASDIFNHAGRSMVTGGLDGWRIVQKFVDDDSFDQDLMIETISNFSDRVWFDSSAEKQDRSDAKFCWVLQGITREEYEERWPNGSGQSVSQDRTFTSYFNQPDLIMVGEYYHIVEVERELVLMSNGAVFEDDEKFKQVADDLLLLGVTETNRRKRKKHVVHVRKFDAGDWLEEDKETVFSWLPVIPTYGNFKVFENKSIYWGAVEKLIDPQRVMNYSLSREIEEGALAPRAKYWGTPKQREGHEDSISTLNTNNEPWQDYNADPAAPGSPMQQGGAQINPGLRIISDSMGQMITQSAGLFAANMGDNPNAQSGVAITQLQNKGDTGTIKYFKAQEIAICHTARILINAIPDVYSSQRQVRLLKEDGSVNMVTLNEKIVDQDTQQIVELNDLSVGTYDVACSSGPSFQNKQQETVAAMVEVAQVDPTIIELGGDILLNNIAAPGMNMMAERKRQMLFNQGVIPQDQWTEEEQALVQQQQAQAQQNPPQPTPEELIGQAEILKAQTDARTAQVKEEEAGIKLQQAQQKLEQEDRKLDQSEMQLIFDKQEQQSDQLNKAIDGLKTLTEAFGIDVLAGEAPATLIAQQGALVDQEQDRN